MDTSSISLHSIGIGRHAATQLFISFYSRPRQRRFVVFQCTQSTATDTILYTSTQIFCLFYNVERRRSLREETGGQILHWEELLWWTISFKDINARSDWVAVGEILTTRLWRIGIQGASGSPRNLLTAFGPALERGRGSGPRIEVNMARHPRLPAPDGGPPLAILDRATLDPWILHNRTCRRQLKGDATEQG